MLNVCGSPTLSHERAVQVTGSSLSVSSIVSFSFTCCHKNAMGLIVRGELPECDLCTRSLKFSTYLIPLICPHPTFTVNLAASSRLLYCRCFSEDQLNPDVFLDINPSYFSGPPVSNRNILQS